MEDKKVRDVNIVSSSHKEEPIAFGVGCLFFPIEINSLQAGETLSSSDYAELLKLELNKLSSISNLSISCDVDWNLSKKVLSKEDASLFNDVEIKFDIHIPFRVQDDLGYGRKSRKTSEVSQTEDFRFEIHTGYRFPSAFIRSLGTQEFIDPSENIIIVREYIKRELKDRNSRIRLEALGPSPLHCNIHIGLGVGDHEFNLQESIKSSVVTSRGYDDIYCFYDPEMYDDVEEAYEHLKMSLSQELDLYYFAVSRNDIADDLWNSIYELSYDLESPKGLINRMTYASKIAQAHSMITKFSLFDISSRDQLASAYRSVYDTDEEAFIKHINKPMIDNLKKHPIDDFMKMISFIESRRSKNVEVVYLAASTLVGAGVGALITYLVAQKSGGAIPQMVPALLW